MNSKPPAAATITAVLASLIVIGLSGPAAAASEVPPPGVGGTTIIAYLDALDTVDASPALAVASPRSAAFRYAEHQVAFEESRREIGLEASVAVMTPLGAGRFQLCSGEVTPSCPVFADFTADRAGLISAFTVDGVEITPRIGDPSDPGAFWPGDCASAVVLPNGAQRRTDRHARGRRDVRLLHRLDFRLHRSCG